MRKNLNQNKILMSQIFTVSSLIAFLFGSIISCQKPKKTEETTTTTDTSTTTPVASAPSKYLYVASGTCYAGGLTPETASRTVAKINLTTGNIEGVVADYTKNPGDNPVGIVNYDDENVLVLVENASGRRVDIVSKSTTNNSFSTFLSNSTALSAQLRGMFQTPDGGYIVSKSTAIEKFSSSKSRVLVGANPYVNAPGGSCATSTTLISGLATLNNGKIVFAHAAASQNRFGIVSANGYSVAADCLSAQTAPNANAFPTAMVYIGSSSNLLVSYAGTVAGVDYIYSYDINETTNAISGVTKSYENTSVLRGVSAMAFDSSGGYLYAANGSTSLSNTIEKFTYDGSTKTLTRIGTVPFSMPTVYHKCISAMTVAN